VRYAGSLITLFTDLALSCFSLHLGASQQSGMNSVSAHQSGMNLLSVHQNIVSLVSAQSSEVNMVSGQQNGMNLAPDHQGSEGSIIAQTQLNVSIGLDVQSLTPAGGPYDCNVCGQQFQFLPDLRMHSVIHVRQRPRECVACRKRFIFPSDLKRHSYSHRGTSF